MTDVAVRIVGDATGLVEAMRASAKALDDFSASQRQAAGATAPLASGLDKVEGGIRTTSKTTKELELALRGVPAQFTDIFVSLQAGQNPLTVFLQQGGQLKDMFGGASVAARAMGGYVLGLVNPFSVAAVVVGVLGLAYQQGSKEADTLRVALLMSGNAAGTTVGQMSDMAASMDKVRGTQGSATEALAAMAATGQVAKSSLEQFASVAQRMEMTVGKPIKDTAKDFAELGKSPVEASLKLAESLNHLSLGAYKKIKALEDIGKTQQAAALAQNA